MINTQLDENYKELNENVTDMKRNQKEMKNEIAAIKNTMEGLSSRLEVAEYHIRKLGDKAGKHTQTQQQLERILKKQEESLTEPRTTHNKTTSA
jgi:predicted phage tail protein